MNQVETENEAVQACKLFRLEASSVDTGSLKDWSLYKIK